MANKCFQGCLIAAAVIFIVAGILRQTGCDSFAQPASAKTEAKQTTQQMVEVCNSVGLIRLILEAEDRKNKAKKARQNNDNPAGSDEGHGALRRRNLGDH